MFIDETWASTNMARKRGRCRRGRRLRAAIPHGHYKTVTLVAGLRLCGLVAQKAFDRPINAASFEEWVEKCLVPTLGQIAREPIPSLAIRAPVSVRPHPKSSLKIKDDPVNHSFLNGMLPFETGSEPSNLSRRPFVNRARSDAGRSPAASASCGSIA